jgi:phage terminase large subunit GpA-like protein
MADFETALSDVCAAWPALQPPSRIRVSQGAATSLVIKRPGGASGNWNPNETPYMVEPMDMLASRVHSGVCFVGSAQSGKTVGIGEGWLTHAVLNDPGDMLIVQMTQDKAREYSKQRIDRAIRNSPALRAMRSAQARDDNLHDKQFANGMWVRIAWPTATNLSSTSYRYVFGTDYDRWDDNIDGEGDGFTLMGKRVTTFLSRGMVAVESSPGRPVVDPSWQPASAHEAPPVEGILGIYNRSDRRRWYWSCPHCGEWMQATPGLGMFHLPSDDEILETIREIDIDAFARQHARVACPANGCIVLPPHREGMNRAGRWVQDGLTLDARGRLSGNPRTSSIAGYWLGGVAAAYTSWEGLIRKHLQALLEYELTGNELPLQTTANTDQGIPYTSRRLAEAARTGADGQRVEQDLPRYVVPDEGRFLVATVDVQGGKNARFVVQVHAVGEHKEQWLVDRYAITLSKREGMDGEPAPLDPAAYPEDWDLLTEKVVDATYRTNDPDREMKVRLSVVDSGGEDGVTNNAYAWYRRLRRRGKHRNVRLIKGASTRVDWHIRESMVGGKQGEGDVPLFLLDPNKFKDMVSAGLQRRSPGPGYYHFPAPKGPANPDGWLLPAFFDELHAEVRNKNGTWEQVKKRNESFDLCYMALAGCMMLGVDKREFWASPPTWALPHDRNSEIVTPEARRQVKAEAATAAPAPMERRVRRSAYMG